MRISITFGRSASVAFGRGRGRNQAWRQAQRVPPPGERLRRLICHVFTGCSKPDPIQTDRNRHNRQGRQSDRAGANPRRERVLSQGSRTPPNEMLGARGRSLLLPRRDQAHLRNRPVQASGSGLAGALRNHARAAPSETSTASAGLGGIAENSAARVETFRPGSRINIADHQIGAPDDLHGRGRVIGTVQEEADFRFGRRHRRGLRPQIHIGRHHNWRGFLRSEKAATILIRVRSIPIHGAAAIVRARNRQYRPRLEICQREQGLPSGRCRVAVDRIGFGGPNIVRMGDDRGERLEPRPARLSRPNRCFRASSGAISVISPSKSRSAPASIV